MTMRALDLFCGAGGAAVGLHRAGFEVVGVDHKPQPRYPFEFHQGDALEHPTEGFDLIWASPPCQRFSVYSRNTGTAENHPDLIEPTREKIQTSGTNYIIENVPGAPLVSPVTLCGSMFDLDVRRHRLFECSFAVLRSDCKHWIWRGRVAPVPVYGNGSPRHWREKHGRDATKAERASAMDNGPLTEWYNRFPVDVTGGGGRQRGEGSDKRRGRCKKPVNVQQARDAMGIDWMTREELSQAIPPAYAEFLGRVAIRAEVT